jgi:hypothetical protein
MKNLKIFIQTPWSLFWLVLLIMGTKRREKEGERFSLNSLFQRCEYSYNVRNAIS